MNPSSVVLATQPVVDAFETLDIAYYIGGSVASSAYGMARATMDVDMVAEIKPQHVPAFVDQLAPAYYIDQHMIMDAIRRQASFNLIHLETMIKVDVFVLKNGPYPHTALQRRRQDTIEPGAPEFYLAAAEDIVLSKLDWYRMGGEVSDRQWSDILGVLKVQQTMLDMAYLERWAAHLRLLDLLRRALTEAGIAPEQ